MPVAGPPSSSGTAPPPGARASGQLESRCRVREGDLQLSDASHISAILRDHHAGDSTALGRLVPLVYEELRRIARYQLRRTDRGQTLDTAGLVHDAYLKLARQHGLALNDRQHLLAVTARAMRQVIVSRARARAADKRAGARQRVPLEDGDAAAVEAQAEWLLDVDRALEALRGRDERLSTLVECRFFAGMSEEESAAALSVSVRTVQRDWKRARAWLRAELEGDTDRDG